MKSATTQKACGAYQVPNLRGTRYSRARETDEKFNTCNVVSERTGPQRTNSGVRRAGCTVLFRSGRQVLFPSQIRSLPDFPIFSGIPLFLCSI